MAAEPKLDSYYAASRNDTTEYPPLIGDTQTDICVVGGGYAGLSTALELSMRGYRVVLLEANRIGWGASGRNGGQIVSGFSAGMDKIRAWVGRDDARHLWQLAEEAKTLLRERVARHEIRCDLKSGYLFAGLKPRHVDWLKAEYDLWTKEYDYPCLELLDRVRMREEVNSDLYIAGLLDRGGGHLHPLNYALGLARAAREQGVMIHERSAVTGVDDKPIAIVKTESGSVRADHVVMCVNAYLGGLVPSIQRKIMPVGTYVAATEPLGEALSKSLIPHDIAVADIKLALDYYRLSADRRLLFGGKVSYTTVPPPNLKASMRRAMVKVFPQLSGIGIDYAWGGYVAITVERTPHLGRIGKNTYFAQGFSGHGVALTGIAGRVIAGAIAGTAERFDVFARLPHTTFFGGAVLRMPVLALAMLYKRLQDLF